VGLLDDTIFQQAPDGRRHEQHVQHSAVTAVASCQKPNSSPQTTHASTTGTQLSGLDKRAVVLAQKTRWMGVRSGQQLNRPDSNPRVNEPQTAENKFKPTGIQATGRRRNGRVNSHSSAGRTRSQFQPATCAVSGRLAA